VFNPQTSNESIAAMEAVATNLRKEAAPKPDAPQLDAFGKEKDGVEGSWGGDKEEDEDESDE